jgi:hypothetical protein
MLKGLNRTSFFSVLSNSFQLSSTPSAAMAEITYLVALPFVAADDGVTTLLW